MLIIMLLTTLVWRTGAIPISTGPITTPTVIHSIVFGISARSGCSDVRSMYEIVRSCFFTIAACVYRAVHPNIPDPNASLWKKIRVTVKITVYALIAPEVIIFWAMRQRFGANVVVTRMNEIKPELRWTQTHGQFAQMGGFGRKDTKHIIYPETLIDLLQRDQLDIEELQLTEKEINDKSKGDILSKGLVAFQTSWFIFECLARLQQGLPIIELEVVTLAFATLNAITYALWWYKPLNVSCPIYLHIRTTSPHTATNSDTPAAQDDHVANVEAEPFIRRRETGGREAKVKRGIATRGKGAFASVRDIANVVVAIIGEGVDRVKQDVYNKGWAFTMWEWLLSRPFLAICWPLWELLSDNKTHDEATHVSTFYGMEISNKDDDQVIHLSGLIGMVFGAIHFLSWTSTFPTTSQLILWRTSSIVMVVQPCLILLSNTLGMIYNRSPIGSRRERTAKVFGRSFEFISIFVGTVPYIVARLIVLVLSFVTLRDLPLPAFKNVSWSSYIPHI